MKAAVTTGEKRKLVIEDIPKPRALPGTLLLKMKCVSICGTDLEYLDGHFDYLKGEGGKIPVGAILGHEFCAEVVEVGEGVEGWSVGDRAVPGGVPQGCGKCYFCRNRLPSLCLGVAGVRSTTASELTPPGTVARNGAFAEYFVRQAVAVQKMPKTVSDEEAAFVEPLHCGIGAVQVANIRPGDSAVIYGAGKIGLGAMQCAKIAGASPVIMIDVIKSRLDTALEMGADKVINAAETDAVCEVVKLTEAGPDAILICTRAGKVLNEAVDMARRGGVIVLVGFVPPTEINPGVFVWKNITLAGTLNTTPWDLNMRLIANGQVNYKPLTKVIMPLEDVQKAFDSMYSGENIVVLLKP